MCFFFYKVWSRGIVGGHVACFCFIAVFLVIFRKVLLVLCNTRVQSHYWSLLLTSTFTAKVSCKLIWGSLACYISVYVTFFCQVFHRELCVYRSFKEVLQKCCATVFFLYFFTQAKSRQQGQTFNSHVIFICTKVP